MSKRTTFGEPLTVEEANAKITATKGRFFGVTFVKKDGTVRSMTCRLGVRKGVTGKGLKFSPAARNLRVVHEAVVERASDGRLSTVTGQFRMIPTDARLTAVKTGGKHYPVIT